MGNGLNYDYGNDFNWGSKKPNIIHENIDKGKDWLKEQIKIPKKISPKTLNYH